MLTKDDDIATVGVVGLKVHDVLGLTRTGLTMIDGKMGIAVLERDGAADEESTIALLGLDCTVASCETEVDGMKT